MLHRKGVARVAACAALACMGLVCAQSNGATSDDGLLLRPLTLDDTTQPAAAPSTEPTAAPATPPSKPLMYLLEQAPPGDNSIGKKLESANITMGGYIEGSYIYSASAPPGNNIAGHIFDTRHEHPVLNQIDFFIDKAVDYSKPNFDVGGHIEIIYGWDAGVIHSNGLFDNSSTRGTINGYYRARNSPENQFDLNQAYLDFAIPVGTGLRIRAGKFDTLLGYEVINPTQNALFSHSYMFGLAIPFTQTGIMGEYKLNAEWQIDAGVTRGWDQSLDDNNGDPDFLGEVTYTPQGSDELKKWTFILNVSEGPQSYHDNSNYWTVLDFVAKYKLNDNWNFGLNADYGDAPHAVRPSSAQWYGIAGYAQYIIDPHFTVNGRAEYYGDQNGFTTGAGVTENLYEATVGLAITPFPDNVILQNFVVRPELRVDYSEKKFFDNGTDHYQFTAQIDAYFVY